MLTTWRRGRAVTTMQASRGVLMQTIDPARRRALILGAAPLGLGFLRTARAAEREPLRKLGAFALLGDTVDVTVVNAPISDTRLPNIERRVIDVPNIGFDAIVLGELAVALRERAPQAQLKRYRAHVPLAVAAQREIAAGARRAEMPGWIVQSIVPEQLTHILIATRGRAQANLATASRDAIGRGQVEGIGFYVDPLFVVRHVDTGAVANGALGAFVLVDLLLVDARSGEVVREHALREQILLGAAEPQAAVDPWSYLSGTEKAQLLRGMLERNLRRVLPGLLS